MNFKELKKGFPVYIINKDTVEYSQGKVAQDATPPRLNTVFGQPMITDVSIESNGITKIWTLPADQKVAEMQTDSNIIISTDKSAIIAMVKNIQTECETYLQGVELNQKRLETSKKLIAELDVTYKQQQQTEERFNRIEESIAGINGTVSSLGDTLSQILKAVNSK